MDKTSKLNESNNYYIRRMWNYINENSTVISRIAVIVTLIIATAAYGFGAYYIVRNNEVKLSDTQYYSLSKSAIDSIEVGINGRIEAAQTMSTIYRSLYPEYSTWPNVTLPNFEDIARHCRLSASAQSFGTTFFPLVNASDRASFEAFASDYILGLYPDGNVGTVDGEVAIWKPDQFFNRIRDDGGNDPFLFPYLQVEANDDFAAQVITMFNLYSDPIGRATFDSIVKCVESNNGGISLDEQSHLCSSSYIATTEQSISAGYYGIISPITVDDNGVSKLVGVIGNQENFDSILDNIFPEFVRGIDIIVEGTDGRKFSYSIEGKNAKFVGNKDSHDSSYNKYRKRLYLSNEDLLDISPVYYTVSIYPTKEFFEYYETDILWIAMVLAVSIIIFAAIIFLIYDYAMQRESKIKSAVLEAKRNFVRFISHEIRTPLNTVYLGLRLLEQGLTKRLDQLRQQTSSCVNENNNHNKDDIGVVLSDVIEHESVKIDRTISVPARLKFVKDIINTTDESILDDWLEICQDLLVNVRNAVDVLTDILNYDKVQMGTLTLDVSAIPVWSTVTTTVRAFDLQAQEKHITLNMNLDNATDGSNQLVLMGDEGHLIQVIRNLVSNALKFTPENGTITVTGEWIEDEQMCEEASKKILNLSNKDIDKGNSTSTSNFCLWNRKQPQASSSAESTVYNIDDKIHTAGVFRLTVTDDGEGLSEEQLNQMFQEGVQFNRNRLQAGGGSGLGLAISKGIVTQHGGSIKVTSEGLGLGSTFTLVLPVFLLSSTQSDVPNETSVDIEVGIDSVTYDYYGSSRNDNRTLHIIRNEDPTASNTLHNTDVATNTTSCKSIEDYRILVVDDANLNRKMLVRLLNSKGHSDITQAIDGLDAIEKYKEAGDNGCPFDLVLMDYEMPNMNGPTAAMNLRLLGAMMPIIGVTGNVLPADKKLFVDNGADDVVGKPFEYSVLTDILERLQSTSWKPVFGTELEKQLSKLR